MAAFGWKSLAPGEADVGTVEWRALKEVVS